MKTNKTLTSFFIISFFLLYAIFISYPLINNLHSILLPFNYLSPVSSDIYSFINNLRNSKQLLLDNRTIFNITSSSEDFLSVTFNFFGILLSFFIQDYILVINLFFLIVLTFSGYFSFLLSNYLIKDKLLSILSGVLYVTSNYIFHQYYWGHVNLIQIQFLPLIVLFFIKLSGESRPNFQLCLITSFFYSLQLFSCVQYSIYLTVILLFTFVPVVLVKNYKNIRILCFNFIIFSLSFLVITGYYICKRLYYHKAVVRSLEENLIPGFHLNSLLNLVDPNHKVFVGSVSILYFLISIIYLCLKCEKNNKIWFWSFILMFIFSLLFMFGPINNLSPYYLLYKYFPLINKFRVSLRFFPFLLLSIVNVYAFALSVFLRRRSTISKILFILLLWLSLILQYLNSSYFIGRYLYSGSF